MSESSTVTKVPSEEILGICEQPDMSCPKIDKVIKSIHDAYSLAERGEHECRNDETKSDISDYFTDIQSELWNCEDDLEIVRSINGYLRAWGEEWKDLAKKLLDKYEPNWRNKSE